MEEKNWYDGVPAPFDADGNVVPLTTRKLYRGDGREVEVGEVSLVSPELNGDCVWCVRTPDGAALVLNLLHVERPDGPRYKAIGNSMAVPVMRWIFERIEAVDNG